MAKTKDSKGSAKISFGKKKTGVAKKSYSKYEEKPKKYVGQGRQKKGSRKTATFFSYENAN